MVRACPDRKTHNGVVDTAAQRRIERHADPTQQANADEVQAALQEEQDDHQHGQADEGRHAAARQHAVIDLEHEHRSCQHQDVADGTEHRDASQGRAARPQGLCKFPTLGCARGCMSGCRQRIHRPPHFEARATGRQGQGE